MAGIAHCLASGFIFCISYECGVIYKNLDRSSATWVTRESLSNQITFWISSGAIMRHGMEAGRVSGKVFSFRRWMTSRFAMEGDFKIFQDSTCLDAPNLPDDDCRTNWPGTWFSRQRSLVGLHPLLLLCTLDDHVGHPTMPRKNRHFVDAGWWFQTMLNVFSIILKRWSEHYIQIGLTFFIRGALKWQSYLWILYDIYTVHGMNNPCGFV